MWKDLAIIGTLAILFASAPALAQEAPLNNPQASPPAVAEEPMQSSPPAGEEMGQQGSQTETLVGLPIYSSDEQKVGEVSAVDTSEDGTVQALHADVGGFLGIGQKTVRIPSDSFARKDDRIVLSITADEVGTLPAVGE